MGIPVIGCGCAVCRSSDPRNKRLRSSLFIEREGKRLLLDAGPDFREQALRYNITGFDALLLTHGHFDHIGGMDDLRVYNFMENRANLCFLSKETFDDLIRRFYYFFLPHKQTTESAQFNFQVLHQNSGTFSVGGIEIGYFSYFQKEVKVTGFRIGNFAYVTDIREYDRTIFTHLKGVDTLVISALRDEPSPVHFSFKEGIDFARIAAVKKTYFTHIAHDIDYKSISKSLPEGFHVAYDGLSIELDDL